MTSSSEEFKTEEFLESFKDNGEDEKTPEVGKGQQYAKEQSVTSGGNTLKSASGLTKALTRTNNQEPPQSRGIMLNINVGAHIIK